MRWNIGAILTSASLVETLYMKIVVVSTYCSSGMGYTENCLPRVLAARGHDVHLLTWSLIMRIKELCRARIKQ